VSADNVLMRLALRSGLVEQGDVEEVREATRDAFKQVAEEAGISPPVLDDLLWERGRENPDLIGDEAGDLTEPPRREGSVFY
jgi:N-glycosylase/DNA lyase